MFRMNPQDIMKVETKKNEKRLYQLICMQKSQFPEPKSVFRRNILGAQKDIKFALR